MINSGGICISSQGRNCTETLVNLRNEYPFWTNIIFKVCFSYTVLTAPLFVIIRKASDMSLSLSYKYSLYWSEVEKLLTCIIWHPLPHLAVSVFSLVHLLLTPHPRNNSSSLTNQFPLCFWFHPLLTFPRPFFINYILIHFSYIYSPLNSWLPNIKLGYRTRPNLHPLLPLLYRWFHQGLQCSQGKKIQWPLCIKIPPSPLCITWHCRISLYVVQSQVTKVLFSLEAPSQLPSLTCISPAHECSIAGGSFHGLLFAYSLAILFIHLVLLTCKHKL